MKNNQSKVIAAFLTGAAAGAILGLLYAPASGTETRQKISDGIKKTGDKVKSIAEQTVEKISNLIHSGAAEKNGDY